VEGREERGRGVVMYEGSGKNLLGCENGRGGQRTAPRPRGRKESSIAAKRQAAKRETTVRGFACYGWTWGKRLTG